MSSHPDLVPVYRGGGGPIRADMLRSFLAGSDIECAITGLGLNAAYPTSFGSMGEFTILVRQEDAETARALIEDVVRDEAAGIADDA